MMANGVVASDLEKSVKGGGSWRSHDQWFKDGSGHIPKGCINLSPAWFQQAHEVRDPM
jgi:hypothetical protein